MTVWTRIFNDGFTAHLGAIEQADAPGDLFRFACGPQHAGPDGAVSRGVLLTLIDTALWAVVLARTHGGLAPPAGQGAATVSLNADFIAPVQAGETVFLRGAVTRRTRTIVFAQGQAFVTRADGDHPVLAAQGVWKILGA